MALAVIKTSALRLAPALLAMILAAPEGYAEAIPGTNCSVSIYWVMGWDHASPGSFEVRKNNVGIPVESNHFSYDVGAPVPHNCAGALQSAEEYALTMQTNSAMRCTTVQRDYDAATACNGQ